MLSLKAGSSSASSPEIEESIKRRIGKQEGRKLILQRVKLLRNASDAKRTSVGVVIVVVGVSALQKGLIFDFFETDHDDRAIEN